MSKRTLARSNCMPHAVNIPYPYNGFLGSHTNGGIPKDHGGVSNWVEEYGPNENSLLLDSVRYPEGTQSNWIDWSTQRLSIERLNIFTDSGTLASAGQQESVNITGFPDAFPFDAYFDWINGLSVQPTRIFAALNVYSQTIDEIKAGIDAFKIAAGSRAIHWELGNEVNANGYLTIVNNAFSTLAGADLATAYTYMPLGPWDVTGTSFIVKNAEIINYIRDNYPGDKIGVPSQSELGHRRPDTGSSGFPVYNEQINSFADVFCRYADVDGVIEHPYIAPSEYWAELNNSNTALYTDAKWLAAISEPAENTYRWMMAYAEHGPELTVRYHRQKWRDKELWLTEMGNLLDHNDSNITDRPTEIHTSTTQCVARYTWLMSYYIAWAKQAIKTDGKVTAVMHHAARRDVAGSPAASHFSTSIYPAPISMTAGGVVFYLLRYLRSGLTHFAVPIVTTAAALKPTGVLNYGAKKINPIRALFFQSAAEQRLLVLNVSPNARTVTIPFKSYSIHGFNPATNSLSLWSSIPTDTFYDVSDFTTGSGSASTYAIPAYACYVFSNTGAIRSTDSGINVTVT